VPYRSRITEFEQRGAYFDGDPVIATKKGVNILERGSQVHDMAEVQELFDFPPAPKLDIYGKLDPGKATPAELRGQEIFFGKGQCAACHTPPYYTDNTMHNVRVERFYKPEMINGMLASADGPIKPFRALERCADPISTRSISRITSSQKPEPILLDTRAVVIAGLRRAESGRDLLFRSAR
jgi:cytochrome c peroxidase